MDLDDSFGIPSAFQLVPEAWSPRADVLVDRLRSRGFEVNLHDLSHDGSLFLDRVEFLDKARRINARARDFQSRGFRSGSMYREQSWFEAFEFAYDMSVPNVAHLEPQRGGCCTVMPYFVGGLLELPLTTTQDYSLFHVLGDYTTALWRQQIELVLAHNGLVSFIAHPDYLREPRAEAVYVELLELLSTLRAKRNVWITLPGEVDRWWRSRSALTLVHRGGGWRVEGADSSRARVGYASLANDRVVYAAEPSAEPERSMAAVRNASSW
jgi:hypothetical protein